MTELKKRDRIPTRRTGESIEQYLYRVDNYMIHNKSQMRNANGKSKRTSKSKTKKVVNYPKYDESMTVNEYLENIDKFSAKSNKNKYDFVLKFVNSLLNLHKDDKFVNLTRVSNIDEQLLINKRSVKILKKFEKEIYSIFDIKCTFSKEILDGNNDKYIIFILGKMLRNIQYRLVRRIVGKSCYYSIKISK